jgi:hypothetical protein
MELNLFGYRSPMWGDFGVALYAARPTVWLAYKKRKLSNDYNQLCLPCLLAMARPWQTNKNALKICEIGGCDTKDTATRGKDCAAPQGYLAPRAPRMKWPRHPNLRCRPATPATGRGRVQQQIRRAFMATGAKVLTSSEIYDWTHTRRRLGRNKKLPWGVYNRTVRTLRAMCDPVGRVPPYGARLWRLKEMCPAKMIDEAGLFAASANLPTRQTTAASVPGDRRNGSRPDGLGGRPRSTPRGYVSADLPASPACPGRVRICTGQPFPEFPFFGGNKFGLFSTVHFLFWLPRGIAPARKTRCTAFLMALGGILEAVDGT